MRSPQPNFTFPITPPDTAGAEDRERDQLKVNDTRDDRGRLWTPEPGTSPLSSHHPFSSEHNALPPPSGHVRAASDSTIRDTNSVLTEVDSGAFKIVISKPGDDRRPKTAENVDKTVVPHLDIAIPSWRLGRPQFSHERGTFVMRGSSCAPTESEIFSNGSAYSRRPSSQALPNSNIHDLSQRLPLGLTPSNLQRPLRTTYLSTYHTIEPAMFEHLTFKPASIDASVVRHSPNTGAVTAATAPRLVAEITSPSFLDYELISDFFLTFRIFLDPNNLIKMLIARLRWAIMRDDEIGMVVRVRTFVALRHWVLNYFSDDFVPDHSLRTLFCKLVNEFVEDLCNCPKARTAQFKILIELNKCWRRVCAQYWDDPSFDDVPHPDFPLQPGDVTTQRYPQLDSRSWGGDHAEALASAKPGSRPGSRIFDRTNRPATSDARLPGNSNETTTTGTGAYGSGQPQGQQGQGFAAVMATSPPLLGPTSPNSMASTDIVSCSFPGMTLRPLQSNPTRPVAPSALTAAYVQHRTGPVAAIPAMLSGKRVRPAQTSQRGERGVDDMELKEYQPSPIKENERPSTRGYGGRLVRGNLLAPGEPYVDVQRLGTYRHGYRQTTTFESEPHHSPKDKMFMNATTNNGMKKLFGGVRRALSSRNPDLAAPQSNYLNIPLGPRGMSTNALPSAGIPQEHQLRLNGTRQPVRIDLLAAEISEDFKRAVREEEAAERVRQGHPTPPLQPDMSMGKAVAQPVPATDPTRAAAFGHPEIRPLSDPTSDMGMTVGSQSIMIVDGTGPLDTGISPFDSTGNSSMDAFQDRFLPEDDRLTPPNTPPARNDSERLRSSSLLLNLEVTQPLASVTSSQPPPVVNTAIGRSSSGRNPSGGPYRSRQQSSRSTINRGSRYPQGSDAYRAHRRNVSTRTQQSLNSIIQQHVPSLRTSSIFHHSSIRSFDATTCSDPSIYGRESYCPMPEPGHVLRRRPGGDLRAFDNIGDLGQRKMRRSRSVGSLTTYSESIQAASVRTRRFDSFGKPSTPQRDGTGTALSSLLITDPDSKSPQSPHAPTASRPSKPRIRQSFEAEAQILAQIPDHDEDGSRESALMKLEGTFHRVLSASSEVQAPAGSRVQTLDHNDVAAIGVALGDPSTELAGNDTYHKPDTYDRAMAVTPTRSDLLGAYSTPESSVNMHLKSNATLRSFLSMASQETYSSTPLLDGGQTDDGQSRSGTQAWTNRSVLDTESDDEDKATPLNTIKHRPYLPPRRDSLASFEFIQKTGSMDLIRSGRTLPSSTGEQSFLNDDSDGDDNDDISSNLSNDNSTLGALPAVCNLIKPRRNVSIARKQMSLSPTAVTNSSTEAGNIPELHADQIWIQTPGAHSPGMSSASYFRRPTDSTIDPTGTKEALRGAPKSDIEVARRYSAHLPFILAVDSEILAQQFTLIEKDALNEIDWKELIDMRWKNSPINDFQSWVDFLRNPDARGVEIVIARFNIMVKWAISEIILTKHLEERARCIIKYIHIAAHCRRYRNFATLAQIAIALTSNEIARLSRTWNLVPAADIKTLKGLEALVTPTRNFYNLRLEMETSADTGCIPFVGIYTHDLLFNAQRPAEIASSPSTAPLINFERCRIAATVVKTLLRLLAASSHYNFQPVEGVTEPCLWMAALTNEQIRKQSVGLE